MAPGDRGPGRAKISFEFAKRIEGFGKHDLVRAIVTLAIPAAGTPDVARNRRARRNEVIAKRRDPSKTSLDALDAALALHGGKRLGGTTLLGTVPVETTPAGIDALAALDSVRSIMEDQPITLID